MPTPSDPRLIFETSKQPPKSNPLNLRPMTKLLNWMIFTVLTTTATAQQLVINSDIYIHSHAQMHIALADTQFHNGSITTSRDARNFGKVSFASGSRWHGADHQSHVDGYVRAHGDFFDFPVGHDQVMTALRFQRTETTLPIDVAYAHIPHSDNRLPEGIDAISPFYWTVKSQAVGRLHLSWGVEHNLPAVSQGALENLYILGHTGQQWEVIEADLDLAHFMHGDIVDEVSGSLHSTEDLKLDNYQAFALGAFSGLQLNFSEGFTPNGDGINDTWYIEHIENYPQALIKVFNRWGQEVFQARNYRNNWNGTYRNNREPLPSAPYFYTIDVENDGEVDRHGWIYINR